MDFLPSVIRAKYEGGFRIHFTFSDNVQGTIDLQSWLEGPIFEPLKDRSYFHQFFIDGGTVVWPNGQTSHPKRCTRPSSSQVRPNHALEPTAPSRAERRGSARSLGRHGSVANERW
jgi:hypothetical protein